MMPLHIDNVPDELIREIEQLAATEQVPVAVATVRLLEEAVHRKRMILSAKQPVAKRSAREILDDIARNRFRGDPGGPSVVDLLQEDRNR